MEKRYDPLIGKHAWISRDAFSTRCTWKPKLSMSATAYNSFVLCEAYVGSSAGSLLWE
jgi:hypothetical protein